MKVVDANVLLYAVNESGPHHEPARRWLDGALSGEDRVGFAWIVSLAFLRLATRPGIFPQPLTVIQAVETLDAWHSAPGSVVVHPAPTHAARLATLLQRVGTGGNLINDAHLAVLALEHRASIVTYDADFARFPDTRWHRPDDLVENGSH